MSLYKKDIAKALIVVSLVAVLSIGSYSLFPDALPKMTYATGATIQSDVLATKNFIDEILESEGCYVSIAAFPTARFEFKNGSKHVFRFMSCFNQSGYFELTYENCSESSHGVPRNLTWELSDEKVTMNASGLKKFSVDWGEGWVLTYPETNKWSMWEYGPLEYNFSAGFGGFKFDDIPMEVNLTWCGNYNKRNEINASMNVENNSIDLGTRFADNNPFVFNLFATTINSTHAQVVGAINGSSGPVSWETGPYWGTDGWLIQTSQLLQLIGQSESASVNFDAAVWLDGNYTVTENGIMKGETMNSMKNIHLGTLDVTSENGTISMVSFYLNPIDIILFVYPEK